MRLLLTLGLFATVTACSDADPTGEPSETQPQGGSAGAAGDGGGEQGGTGGAAGDGGTVLGGTGGGGLAGTGGTAGSGGSGGDERCTPVHFEIPLTVGICSYALSAAEWEPPYGEPLFLDFTARLRKPGSSNKRPKWADACSPSDTLAVSFGAAWDVIATQQEPPTVRFCGATCDLIDVDGMSLAILVDCPIAP